MRKEIADDGMMEEERISDFGFDNFLRFLIPLNAMKEDSIEAKRGEGKFRHSALLIQAMR